MPSPLLVTMALGPIQYQVPLNLRQITVIMGIQLMKILGDN